MNKQQEIFDKKYEIIKQLGKGSFGEVYEVKDISKDLNFAVKFIQKNGLKYEKLQNLLKEAEILKLLDHPNIVKFIEIFETPDKIMMVMELLGGGTLKKLIDERLKNSNWFNQKEINQMIKGILSGVEFMHEKNVVHRDLKPENILIQNPNDLSSIKIVDFGLSAKFDNCPKIMTEFCGTVIFMAPELFNKTIYSKPVDIYSTGIIIYILLNKGQHPLYEQNDNQKNFSKKVQSQKWNFPIDFDENSKNFFLKLVSLDPFKRYSASQALAHPFITGDASNKIPFTSDEYIELYNKQIRFIQIIKAIMLNEYIKKQNFIETEISQEYKNIIQSHQNGVQDEKFLITNSYLKQFQQEEEVVKDEKQIIQQEIQQESKQIIFDHKKRTFQIVNCGDKYKVIISINYNYNNYYIQQTKIIIKFVKLDILLMDFNQYFQQQENQNQNYIFNNFLKVVYDQQSPFQTPEKIIQDNQINHEFLQDQIINNNQNEIIQQKIKQKISLSKDTKNNSNQLQNNQKKKSIVRILSQKSNSSSRTFKDQNETNCLKDLIQSNKKIVAQNNFQLKKHSKEQSILKKNSFTIDKTTDQKQNKNYSSQLKVNKIVNIQLKTQDFNNLSYDSRQKKFETPKNQKFIEVENFKIPTQLNRFTPKSNNTPKQSSTLIKQNFTPKQNNQVKLHYYEKQKNISPIISNSIEKLIQNQKQSNHEEDSQLYLPNKQIGSTGNHLEENFNSNKNNFIKKTAYIHIDDQDFCDIKIQQPQQQVLNQYIQLIKI